MSLLRQLSPLVLAVALLAACGEGNDPFSPEPSDATAIDAPEVVTAAANGGAVVERGETSFTVDFVDYFPCVDEVVHVTSFVPLDFQVVETSSGNVIYHDRIDTDEITGTIEGLTSGRIWVRSQNVSALVERSTGDGGMLHFTFKGDWVSENAPDLKVNEIFHASWNASGELTAEQYRFNCRMTRN